ncbi:MAG: L-seryl-tRNA(Sec) selenium transferase, partial [Chloroflexota bacterium]|nr:L-seryl-tRNA(Sec) selenium transferase [Chloroflexota bacterium]
APVLDVTGLARLASQAAWSSLKSSLRPVVNATGVVLHTNLGRAPLAASAIQAMVSVARGYSSLELDLQTGKRGDRHAHLEGLLCDFLGVEAALAVNNNASAMLLALTALAKGKEVVLSRSQAVEIGGSFRVPDILRRSGARLVEIGTTNRTYLSDYENALTDRTALLLAVHASNFRVVGFTHEVAIPELAELSRRTGVPLVHDLGSGCLLDTREFGLGAEPTVGESVSAGTSLVCFSGDKLLGGPQAGIVVGRKDLVDRLKRDPLARAIRIDKLSLAALHATAIEYVTGRARQTVPVWQMIGRTVAELERKAEQWAGELPGSDTVEGRSTVGGGSLPEETLPTVLLRLPGKASATRQLEALRRHDPPVVARIQDGAVVVDPRTVQDSGEPALLHALRQAV